jgi:cytochrome oxidase Cu insertion factor (SCO1/SenC/PrrC family)
VPAHGVHNGDKQTAPANSSPAVQALSRPRTPAHQYFTDVELIDQNNQRHHFYSDLLQEKVVVITAFYTRCKGSCPVATAKLLQLQDYLDQRLGKEVYFLSITSDPVYDTPSRLHSYAQKLGASPAWLFLTGQKANVHLAHARLGTFGPNTTIADANFESHGNNIFLGNLRTGLWKKIFGPGVNVDELAQALDTLLADK